MFGFLANLALAPVRLAVAPIKVLDDVVKGTDPVQAAVRATVGTVDYVVTGHAHEGSAVEGFGQVGQR